MPTAAVFLITAKDLPAAVPLVSAARPGKEGLISTLESQELHHVVAVGSSFISCIALDKTLCVRPPATSIVEYPWVVAPGAYLGKLFLVACKGAVCAGLGYHLKQIFYKTEVSFIHDFSVLQSALLQVPNLHDDMYFSRFHLNKFKNIDSCSDTKVDMILLLSEAI